MPGKICRCCGGSDPGTCADKCGLYTISGTLRPFRIYVNYLDGDGIFRHEWFDAVCGGAPVNLERSGDIWTITFGDWQFTATAPIFPPSGAANWSVVTAPAGYTSVVIVGACCAPDFEELIYWATTPGQIGNLLSHFASIYLGPLQVVGVPGSWIYEGTGSSLNIHAAGPDGPSWDGTLFASDLGFTVESTGPIGGSLAPAIFLAPGFDYVSFASGSPYLDWTTGPFDGTTAASATPMGSTGWDATPPIGSPSDIYVKLYVGLSFDSNGWYILIGNTIMYRRPCSTPTSFLGRYYRVALQGGEISVPDYIDLEPA